MAELFSWTDLVRWLFNLRRVLPDRVLRWAWSGQQLLAQIRPFPLAEPSPQFFVQVKRENPELTHLEFLVLNLTPFRLGIVAAEGTVSMDSHELFFHEQRFTTEVPLLPYETATFHIRHPLTEPQADRLRGYMHTLARLQISGGIILRTPFGELRKSLSCNLNARIDR